MMFIFRKNYRAKFSTSADPRTRLQLLRGLFCSLFPICGSASIMAVSLTALLLEMPDSLRADEPLAPTITLSLKRGPFRTYHFVPTGDARALLVFGSGDGGWGYFENRVCAFLAIQGIYTVGIDCNKYAETDYDAETLTEDFAAITKDALTRTKNPDLPVIYGGWSMGAVQAVAAAGAQSSPRNLIGLILLSMDERGRYGLRLPDKVGLEPMGSGTFGVADFTAQVANLRVVQLSGADDWMNNTDWIKGLNSPHRLLILENSNHDFHGADERFEGDLLHGTNWVLEAPNSAADRARIERHWDHR